MESFLAAQLIVVSLAPLRLPLLLLLYFYKEFVLLSLPLANDDDDAMHGGVSSSLIFDSPFTSIFTTGAEVQMNFRSLERGEIYQIYESSCKLYGIHPRSANRSHLLLNNNYYDVWKWNIFSESN